MNFKATLATKFLVQGSERKQSWSVEYNSYIL